MMERRKFEKESRRKIPFCAAADVITLELVGNDLS